MSWKRIGLGLGGALLLAFGVAAYFYQAAASDEPKKGSGRGYLGVTLDDSGGKVTVTRVMEGSPAEEAGIKEGDIITRIDGRAVKDAGDVVDAMTGREPGTSVAVTVQRGEAESEKTAKLGVRESEPLERLWGTGHRDGEGAGALAFAMHPPDVRLGMEIMPLSDGLRKYFQVPAGKGVLVSDVVKDSPADRAGIVAGDVVIAVNDESVSGVGDLMQALRHLNAGDKADIRLIRERAEMRVTTVVEKREHGGMRSHSFRFETPSCKDQEEMRAAMQEMRRAMEESRGTLREEIREVIATQVEEARRYVQEAQRTALEEAQKAREQIEKLRQEMAANLNGEYEI